MVVPVFVGARLRKYMRATTTIIISSPSSASASLLFFTNIFLTTHPITFTPTPQAPSQEGAPAPLAPEAPQPPAEAEQPPAPPAAAAPEAAPVEGEEAPPAELNEAAAADLAAAGINPEEVAQAVKEGEGEEGAEPTPAAVDGNVVQGEVEGAGGGGGSAALEGMGPGGEAEAAAQAEEMLPGGGDGVREVGKEAGARCGGAGVPAGDEAGVEQQAF